MYAASGLAIGVGLGMALVRVKETPSALGETTGKAAPADASRFRQCLQPRGDVDAVPEQIAVLYHNVADVDADAENNAAIGWNLSLMVVPPFLHGDGTSYGIDDRDKLHDRAIAHQLDDATPTVCDHGVNDFRTKGFDRGERARFIRLDQA
jgi:hypothetical protein